MMMVMMMMMMMMNLVTVFVISRLWFSHYPLPVQWLCCIETVSSHKVTGNVGLEKGVVVLYV